MTYALCLFQWLIIAAWVPVALAQTADSRDDYPQNLVIAQSGCIAIQLACGAGCRDQACVGRCYQDAQECVEREAARHSRSRADSDEDSDEPRRAVSPAPQYPSPSVPRYPSSSGNSSGRSAACERCFGGGAVSEACLMRYCR